MYSPLEDKIPEKKAKVKGVLWIAGTSNSLEVM
jgi:hypothetical protein